MFPHIKERSPDYINACIVHLLLFYYYQQMHNLYPYSLYCYNIFLYNIVYNMTASVV